MSPPPAAAAEPRRAYPSGGRGPKRLPRLSDEGEHRRAQGLCPQCGRPMRLVSLSGELATWTCDPCLYWTDAKPRSGLYRRARLAVELETSLGLAVTGGTR